MMSLMKEINRLCRCAARDQPCLLSLSVGCCYDYEKPVEPNELSAAVLGGPAILLMENSVAYYAELYPGRSIKKKNLLREERNSGHVSRQLVEPSMPTSCHLDELLTAFPSSWFENVECREIMLPICYQTAEKVFVLGRQAFPATLSQQPSSCLPWKLATPKEVFPSADTGPVRGCGIWVAGLKKQVCVRMSTGL